MFCSWSLKEGVNFLRSNNANPMLCWTIVTLLQIIMFKIQHLLSVVFLSKLEKHHMIIALCSSDENGEYEPIYLPHPFYTTAVQMTL